MCSLDTFLPFSAFRNGQTKKEWGEKKMNKKTTETRRWEKETKTDENITFPDKTLFLTYIIQMPKSFLLTWLFGCFVVALVCVCVCYLTLKRFILTSQPLQSDKNVRKYSYFVFFFFFSHSPRSPRHGNFIYVNNKQEYEEKSEEEEKNVWEEQQQKFTIFHLNSVQGHIIEYTHIQAYHIK